MCLSGALKPHPSGDTVSVCTDTHRPPRADDSTAPSVAPQRSGREAMGSCPKTCLREGPGLALSGTMRSLFRGPAPTSPGHRDSGRPATELRSVGLRHPQALGASGCPSEPQSVTGEGNWALALTRALEGWGGLVRH